MRIKLDRTICDGFGVCAKRAPQYFSLDDWGYASLIGNGSVREQDHHAVMRAVMDCPVHAIIEMTGDTPKDAGQPPGGADTGPAAGGADAGAGPELKTEANEAEWGFTR